MAEKWGSHASNPPLQHSYSMTPHFLPLLVLRLCLPLSLDPLCLSSAVFISFPLVVVFPFERCVLAEKQIEGLCKQLFI